VQCWESLTRIEARLRTRSVACAIPILCLGPVHACVDVTFNTPHVYMCECECACVIYDT